MFVKYVHTTFMKILRKIQKFPQIFKTLKYLLKIAKKIYKCKLIDSLCNHRKVWYQCKVNVVKVVIAIHDDVNDAAVVQ